jgi:hypothetical protein
MPHSICAVSRRPAATRRVPHEERLILKVVTKLYFWDKLPDNRGGVTLAVNLVL